MLKDYLEKYYFAGNYNCAESLLRAANEYYGLELHDRDMILVGGFGAGIQCGNTCGALLAAVSVLSMKYVAQKAHESADIKPVVTAMVERFTEEYKSALCADVKPQCFVPEKRCFKTVEFACDLLESVIADYEAKKA